MTPQPISHLTHQVIQNIFDHYNLGKVFAFVKMKGGYQNTAYLINRMYVLRLTNTDNYNEENGFTTRFQREEYLYRDILPNRGIPSPKCIVYDNSLNILPQEYVIFSFLPGKILGHVYPRLEEGTQETLAYESGTILRNIHNIQENELGDKTSLFKLKNDWQNEIISEFLNKYEKVIGLSELPNSHVIEISKIVENYKELRPEEIPLKLLHFDFHGSHIMVHNKTVAGFFDFEWAQIGDPFWDLQLLPVDFRIKDFKTKDFLKGYGTESFTGTDLIRLKMYAIWQGVWQVWAIKCSGWGLTASSARYGYEQIDRAINYM